MPQDCNVMKLKLDIFLNASLSNLTIDLYFNFELKDFYIYQFINGKSFFLLYTKLLLTRKIQETSLAWSATLGDIDKLELARFSTLIRIQDRAKCEKGTGPHFFFSFSFFFFFFWGGAANTGRGDTKSICSVGGNIF